jgi:hypothetical protein
MLKAHATKQRGNCWSEGGNCAFKRFCNYNEKAVAEEEKQEWGVNGKFLSKCFSILLLSFSSGSVQL